MTTVNELTQYEESQDVQKRDINSHYVELYDYIEKHRINNNPIQISILMPVFNEEKSIKPLIKRLPEHDSIEIIIIDDKSTDNSVNEIRKVQKYRKIKFIQHRVNKGYGGAVLTGFNNSTGEIIVTLDSDGQHCPEDLFKMVKPIFDNEVDFTIGSRYLGEYYYTLPVRTRLGEAILEKTIKLFFGITVMNNQNGYRAFSKKILHIIDDTKFLGYAFATEVILRAATYNYKIREIPIRLHDREHGKSKIKLRVLLMNLISCVIRCYLTKVKLKLVKSNDL